MENHLCVVAFGLRSDGTGEPILFSVPREELFRPVVPQHVQSVPTREPDPIVPLPQRRHALRLRYQSYEEARDLVNEATQLVDRAQERVNQCQTRLREYADMEKHAIDAVVHELKFMNGGTLTHSVADDDEEWNNREKAKRDCAAAEAALERVTAELSHARSIADERNQLLHKAAAFVIGGIIERETDRMVKIQEEAFQLRKQLRSASSLWLNGQALPVDHKSATILTNFPNDVQDPISVREERNQERQRPFMDLFTRLVMGEVEADLSWGTTV